MAPALINFGDIFLKGENEYAFLVYTDEDFIYAVRILNKEDSKKFESVCTRLAGDSTPGKIKDNLLYCYVKLTTKNLEDRLAHFRSADSAINIFPYTTTGLKLNEKDKEDVIKQILDPDVNLPGELKELVGELVK
ncbi:MAG: hypothetical protein PHZ04_05410 [Patescibacteria group bacterium]|nr:hypothetical protein [Patescibacteria group bacterium]MDD5294923.1 hypothetical protein [Patescibacteria group bacterium]MDD5554321.1 hypothetical protein [Patescibacteria group bacterium]